MDIRDASLARYGLVADLNVEAYREFANAIGPEHWATMEATLRNVKARSAESQLIVAEVDGSIAGALAYYPPGGPRSFPLAQMIPPAAAYLAVLAVSPRFRRAGVAGAHRRVHRECIEGARRDGADEIWLVTSELMPAARALYEGFGFTRRGETSHYDVRYWSYSLSWIAMT